MLIDAVSAVLTRLAPNGWSDVFIDHGLDIHATDLAGELSRALGGIDRSRPGFEDLSPACVRAIEPAQPSRSLLYHALASPSVRTNRAGNLSEFPTLAELDVIENYIYATAERSLADLEVLARQIQARFSGVADGSLAVVAMASEYRTAERSVHGGQAEMAYSRTGIARAGTSAPNYVGVARSHWPASGDPTIHVVPVTWNAYLCTKVVTDLDDLRSSTGIGPADPVSTDIDQSFWVPLHKLFDGTECLVHEHVALKWGHHHENTKIARIHQFLEAIGEESKADQDMTVPPFRFTDDLAEFAVSPDLPHATILPIAHANFVELATDAAGSPVTFKVPKAKMTPNGRVRLFWSSLEMRNFGAEGNRPAPEYVHIRHTIDSNGDIQSLNDYDDLMDRIGEAGYEAVHYLDFTGAGFVTVRQTGLSEDFDVKAGHSVIAAPDFYPSVDQRQVRNWHRNLLITEPDVAGSIGWDGHLAPLSAIRLPANPAIENAGETPFARVRDDGTEGTISAVISIPDQDRPSTPVSRRANIAQCSVLPDAAAGIFAPGWAISTDATDGRRHLAAYGLGSPFPEDSKLCAALSAFWPAAAPDTTRTYSPGGNSVAPMIDDELTNNTAWDGINGLTLSADRTSVEFPDRNYADYVESSLNGEFDIRLTAAVTFDEYVQRAKRTAQVRRYLAENPDLGATNFLLASFSTIPEGDQDLLDIQTKTGRALQGGAYRFLIATLSDSSPKPGDRRRRTAAVNDLLEIVAAENGIAHRDTGDWTTFDPILFV